jgi:hypothetical protein
MAVNWMITQLAHRYGHCVYGNVRWYEGRFDKYNETIRRFLAGHWKNTAPGAPHSGMLSQDCMDLVGSLDGSSIPVTRTTGNVNQELFHNHYYFAHMLVLQSITFPDGMCVIDLQLGHHTDISAWMHSPMRQVMLDIRTERIAAGRMPLRLLGDKIFRTSDTVVGMYAERDGLRSDPSDGEVCMTESKCVRCISQSLRGYDH